MANNSEQAGRENIVERGVRALRNLHIAIGAVALAGALVFPAIEIFPVVAVYEGINALAHEGLRRVVRSRPKRNLQPAAT